jgi:hypothetical protein
MLAATCHAQPLSRIRLTQRPHLRLMPPPDQLPTYEMLRLMGEHVSETHRLVGEQVHSAARLQEALDTFQRFTAARFIDLNEAIKRVDTKVGSLDDEVTELRERFEKLHQTVHSTLPEHAERLTELERSRYQRPGSSVTLTEAVERVNNSIIPGATRKEDLGTELPTGSFKVSPEQLDKLIAERDSAKLAQAAAVKKLIEDQKNAEELLGAQEAKRIGQKRKESVITAVAIAATLAFLSLFLWMLLHAAADRAATEHVQPTLTAPAH